jgi:hypothetical protein
VNLRIIVVKAMLVLYHLKRNKEDYCSDAGIDYSQILMIKARKLRGLVFVEENE